MPPVSEAQRKAMQAAAHGHSTLGIPKSVAREFIGEDQAQLSTLPSAAGICYVAEDGDVLLMRRATTDDNWAGHWALPGGKADAGEDDEDAAEREAGEETGNEAPAAAGERKILDRRRTPNGWRYTTYAQPVSTKFWPRLNEEHDGASWFPIEDLPAKTHPAVRDALTRGLNVTEDMQPDDWKALRENFSKWTREEELEPEHAQDGVHATCHGKGCEGCGWTGLANVNYWPMKPKQGAPEYSTAHDEWTEGDHPRANNGQFGQGSGSASSSSKAGPKDGGSASKKSPLKMSHLQKKGGKLGSNEGGLFEGPKGDKFYIKKPGTKAHVKNERQAAALYQLAGTNTLNYRDVEGGEHVATEWKQLEKKNISQFTPEERKEAAKDFAVHCWLANWDAAGTGGDNQGVLGGKVTTLDVGGSLRFRAQGGPKGDAFGDKVKEFDTMRNKGMSPDAARLFAPMTEAELKSSVEKVTAIPDDKIHAAVGDDEQLANTLIGRKKDLAKRVGIAMDAAIEEEGELELAYDRAPQWMDGAVIDLFGDFRQGLAYDKESVRTYSKDGHLHVEEANISKACVNPYVGKEIPRYSELGLDPDKVYRLLRHPAELKKAATTFDGKPILSEHVGITSDNHRKDLTIGSLGTGVRYEHPYLKAPLAFWTQDDIDDIETKRKKELSSAYHYRADMTPGTFEGEDYDGVMRDIVGNHVAHVKEGRAGSDVVVGDSKNPLTQEKFDMSKKAKLSALGTVAYAALTAHMRPLLAMDAKLNIRSAVAASRFTPKNFKAESPKLVAALMKASEGKLLAQDGSIKQGLDEIMDMISGMPEATAAPAQGQDEDDEDAKKGELGAEDDDMDDEDMAGDEDDSEKDDVDVQAGDEDMDDDDKKKKPPFAKDKKPVAGAMDANTVKGLIEQGRKAERQLQQGIRMAQDHVRPIVGTMPNVAFDSAEDVYLKALLLRGVDTKAFKSADAGVLRAVYDNLPKPGAGHRQMALDSKNGGKDDTASTAIAKDSSLAKNLARIGSA
jgi:uncharacterized protein